MEVVLPSVVLFLIFATSYADVCKDRDFRCPTLSKRLCTFRGRDGQRMRRDCPWTCSLCKVSTIAPGVTFAPHIGGCGKRDVAGIRVVGGETAVRGSWPWQVLMMFGGSPLCGGALVDPHWVVTAAHCVYGKEMYPNRFEIRVGDHDRERFEGTEVNHVVQKVFRYPKYSRRWHNNDIALFKLKKAVVFNKFVSSVCLPTTEVPTATRCYITGWGKTHHPGNMARYLQQAPLKVVSQKVCYERNSHRIPIPITDAMICAGSYGTGHQSGCHGDSGGPLVCEVNGAFELHGSVSHGSPTCNSTEAYTVFARTYNFIKWIKETMAKH